MIILGLFGVFLAVGLGFLIGLRLFARPKAQEGDDCEPYTTIEWRLDRLQRMYMRDKITLEELECSTEAILQGQIPRLLSQDEVAASVAASIAARNRAIERSAAVEIKAHPIIQDEAVVNHLQRAWEHGHGGQA